DRSFLLLLSPALTAIWYGVLFTLLLGLQRLIFRMLPAKDLSQNSVKEIETAQERVVDSNPYRSPNVG
ncbi:MAG: hypothetical protein NXI32_28565, partial [bacterium]|nr:hypothetical protein [bacterium]